jgi:uncharacterized protein YecE (DUF72 family)
MTKYFIGTAGWVYRHWADNFYSKAGAQKNWLNYYSTEFNTVEVNSTFYRQASPKTLSLWLEQTPGNFCFSIKANKFATHLKKMDMTKNELAEIINPYLVLGNKKGPILIQLPPFLSLDIERLASFLKRLPRDFRYAFEPRHESWFNPVVYRLLRDNNVSLVAADFGRESFKIIKTADFAYIRLHSGPNYDYLYPPPVIKAIAHEIKSNSKDFNEIFVYFNNDKRGYAVQNARELRGILEARNWQELQH